MDKKLVNTEEQNRAVNPGDSVTQEDSISQEPAHNPAMDTGSDTERTNDDNNRNTPGGEDKA